jgi:hypothetical protein
MDRHIVGRPHAGDDAPGVLAQAARAELELGDGGADGLAQARELELAGDQDDLMRVDEEHIFDGDERSLQGIQQFRLHRQLPTAPDVSLLNALNALGKAAATQSGTRARQRTHRVPAVPPA